MEASREEAVHEPARLVRFAPVEAFAEEPEAAARLVLYDVVVARWLGFLLAPPFGADPLRPLRMGDAMHPSAPTEAARRPLGHDRQHLGGLGPWQEQSGAGRRVRIRAPVGLAFHVAQRSDRAFGDVAFDPPQ